MFKQFKITEVTKENESKYLDGIVELEEDVYDMMIKQGKEGQLFTTGKEDISEYIHSRNNSVFVVTRENDESKVLAATYITQGQIPYTYNDVTKYYKCSPKYAEYVRNQYESEEQYIADLKRIYIQKIKAFVNARDLIISEVIGKRGLTFEDVSEEEKNNIFMKLVQAEIDNPENNFHEKSQIREDLNRYMSIYMDKFFKNSDLYEKFYWVDFDFIKQVSKSCGNNSEIEGHTSKIDSTIETYDKILALQKYQIHDKSTGLDEEKYYTANTDNTIELDTYITSDSVRKLGLARIIVFEGIKKVLERQKFDGEDSIFLVSTLHRDNLSSKYVSEFFGLKDNLFVTRRTGRDREVHICKIEKNEIQQYLNEIEKKLIVLYNYNPRAIKVSDEDRKRILEGQLEYETAEKERLEKINEPKYAGFTEKKAKRISELSTELNKLENTKDIGE
jgi:hypothetical protein